MNLPADVANEALVATGVDFVIGDLQEGTRPAQILLQKYGQCLRQLLRSVHWNFARKQAPLMLLGDASGLDKSVGTSVIQPWVYCYAYPIDCMKARFVPMQSGPTSSVPDGNITPTNGTVPLMGGLSTPMTGAAMRPARYMEAVDPNYTPADGSLFWETQGQSPQGNAVLLTNVKNAMLVYTGLMVYPSLWDSQFRAAMVAFLASEVAFAMWSTKGKPEFGLKVRDEQMKIAAMRIREARVTDGNEGWHSADFVPDWMRFRNVGGGDGAYSHSLGSLGGPGVYYSGCDGCCGVGNTSAY